MSIDQLLRVIRASSLILLSNGRLWAPNTHVPLEIRRAIAQHRRELLCMIATSCVEVCPSPGLHRREFYYKRGQFVCGACERLGIVA